MKVYMLNPPYIPHFGRGMRWQDTGRGGTLYYPIWLSYATGVVEQDYKTRLVDAPAWNWGTKDVVDDARRFNPDLIVIDSSFPSLNNDISVAVTLKENLDSKIVLVGPPASQFPEKILESNGIDIVARFEYDFTVKEVANAIQTNDSLKDVKGISYKEDGRIIRNPNREFTNSEDLDKIPFVSKVYKKHLNIKDYFLGSSLYPEVQIFTGRGCPFLCTFCSWPQTLMGRKYRARSIRNVLDELEWIQENLNVREVFFEDDTFTLSRKRVIEFCEEYKRRKLKVTWACNARADLDYETMKEMKDANCRLLIVGYESGSNHILKNIKKGTTVEQMTQFTKNARKAGLLIHGDFIIGLPGETKQTIQKTRRIMKELKPDILQVSVATPFPGTEFYAWVSQNGYLLTNDPNEYLDKRGHQKAIISYPCLSNEEMTDAVDEILRSYYISINYVPIAIRQAIRRNGLDETRRLLYSAKMFLRYIGERK
jgi:radical SAM superfamily enzyme YgiQ (UPF0313 family)